MRNININELTKTERALYSNLLSIKGDSIIHEMIYRFLDGGDNDHFFKLVATLSDLATDNPEGIRQLMGTTGFKLLLIVNKNKVDA
jgi:hypothetical protein